MNPPNKTAQAAKALHAPIHVRIGRVLRSALFNTVRIAAWVAYFFWLLVPPVMWFSASPAHSHTATYWVGGIYLIVVGLMTWSGYWARKGFQYWNARGEAWAGWGGLVFSLPVLFAPALPFVLLAAVPSMGNGSGQSARERDPTGWDPSYSFYSGNVSYTGRD